jgi:hypothetical protein
MEVEYKNLESGIILATEAMEECPLDDPHFGGSASPCKYCGGTGAVRLLDTCENKCYVYIQHSIKLSPDEDVFHPSLEMSLLSCPICKGVSYGEPYSTDRRSLKQRKEPPPGSWILSE